jgi:hypothetical protein
MDDVVYLDLPPLPDHLKERVYTLVNEYQYKQGTVHNINGNDTWIQDGAEVAFNDNDLGISVKDIDAIRESLSHCPEKTVCTFIVVDCDRELKDWIRENVNPNFYSAYILVARSGNTILPHVDQERSLGYNYILEPAGTPLNCFWKPKTEFEDRPLTPYSYVPYERVDLDRSYHIDSHRWHVIKASDIHSVEGLDTTQLRILIGVGINKI